MGFLTLIPFAGYYVAVLLAIGLADLRWSVLVMSVFAWSRVVPIVVFSELLRTARPSEQMARAVRYSDGAARLAADAWLPRGALLAASAAATFRALVG